MRQPVPSVPPIPAVPGNVEVDSFNIVVAAVAGDWESIRDICAIQDRYANESTLARVTVWFSIVMRNLPDDTRLMFLDHIRRQVVIDSELLCLPTTLTHCPRRLPAMPANAGACGIVSATDCGLRKTIAHCAPNECVRVRRAGTGFAITTDV